MDETQIRPLLDEAVSRGATAGQIKELHGRLTGGTLTGQYDDFVRPAKAIAANAIGGLPDLLMMPGKLMANFAPQDSAARQVPSVTGMVRGGLDRLFPTAPAQSEGQRFVEGAAGFGGSALGGGLGMKMMGKAFAPIAEMMMPKTASDVAAVTGGALGSGAANAIDPNNPWLNAGLSISGGFGGGATAQILGRTGNTVSDIARPFTQSGRQQIVGRAYNEAAQSPQQSINNLQNAPEYVPGSQPMSGNASQDYGLLSLQKGLRTQNGPQFADVESQQNAARNVMLDNMAKSPSYLNTARDIRDNATTPMREQAFERGDMGQQKADLRDEITKLSSQLQLHYDLKNAGSLLTPSTQETSSLEQQLTEKAIDFFANKEVDARPLNKGFFLDELRSFLSTPQASRQSVEQAVNWVGDRIGNQTDPRSLYEIRKDINDAMQGKYSGDLANLKLAKTELRGIKGSLDNAIESAAPGYKNYLSTYAEQSKPINQMETLQDVKNRVMLSAPDAKTGYDFISQPKWSNAVQNPESRAELAKVLTPQQLKNLDLITADLDRSSLVNNSAVRALGSDTEQNKSIASMMGQVIKGTAKGVYGKALDWVSSLNEKAINQLMVEAMLDPKLAAQLMKKANMGTVGNFGSDLMKKATMIGLISSVNSGRKQ